MVELEGAAREFVGAYPTVPAWRAGLGRLLHAIGEVEQAREQLEILAERGFGDIPRDGNWMIAMTQLAELCSALGDASRSAQLYDLLLPFNDVNVVIGIGALCEGSAARYLGLLAACTGARLEAATHFERALAANEALRAPLHIANTQLDYAVLLGRAGTASRLIDAAARSAEELGSAALAARAAALRDG
jgi:tetratricopeptide (TPR) repeat protein